MSTPAPPAPSPEPATPDPAAPDRGPGAGGGTAALAGAGPGGPAGRPGSTGVGRGAGPASGGPAGRPESTGAGRGAGPASGGPAGRPGGGGGRSGSTGAGGDAGPASGTGIVLEGAAEAWTDGVRLGVDVGTVRVGVAASDPGGVLATPLTTLARDPRGGADLVRLARLVADREAVEVIVGLPTSLSGRQGQAARAARGYAAALAERIQPIPVRLSDERLTTVAATRRLAEAGTRGRKGRSVVDRSAAVLILQGWLDRARRAQ